MTAVARTVLPPDDAATRSGREEFLPDAGTTVDERTPRCAAARRARAVVGGDALTLPGRAFHRDGVRVSRLALRTHRAMHRAKEEGRDGARVSG